MNPIPDLAKKTSINSLLNPEASSDAFNSQIPNLTASLNNHQGQPHGQQVDVYGTAYVAAPSFNLRAANWGGPDDRRKPENSTRHYGQGMEVYPEQATPRIVRGREEGGGYALEGNLWPTQQDVVYGASAIAPMYSDERTALSGDYPHHAYPQTYQDQSTSDAPPQSWQLSERASTRIAARGTAEEHRYHAAYYQPASSMYHAPYAPDPTQQPVPRVVQPPPKRRSPDDEAAPPKPKRAKSTTKTPAQAKRGYTAKKRSEAAQIAAQNAKLMPQMSYTPKPTEKGKEKASDGVSMQIVPSGPGDKALHAELQNTRCMSTKYKSDSFPRCVACTRRWAGDTCRFQGIRFFLRDAQMNIIGVSFSETQKADLPSMKFPSEWNEQLSSANIKRTKRTIAQALLPTLRQELKHLRVPQIIHRPREREVRATCDTCMTSIFSSSWLCRLCGREACAECYSTVNELTGDCPVANAAEEQALAARREKHAHSNPFFLQCTKRIEHQARDFSPMSRFDEKELSNAIKEMEELLKGSDGEGDVLLAPGGASSSHQSQNGHPSALSQASVPPVSLHPSLSALSTTTDPAPVPANGSSNPSMPSVVVPGAPLPPGYPPCTTTNSFVPANLSEATVNTPTHPIRRFVDGLLTQETFPLIWSLGEPLVVTGLIDKFKIQWSPEYFISKYGMQGCLIIECQTEVNKRITVGEFFRGFGAYEGRTECWKLKDWPPSTDFKKAFPELYEDFLNAVPVPSYIRRDGVLNIASHFPADTVSPDLGPKMYNAMATTQTAGSKGSTRLHMDMADALNIMTYAAPAPNGTPGCAAWDIYRAEDSEKLRTFLTDHFRSVVKAKAKARENGDAAAAGTGASGTATDKTKRGQGQQEWQGINDPIHAQAIYLDEDLRAALFAATGVKSYRLYQRPGEAVFIPAGCAHQVANLADCVKVAVDFVSPENVERCERLTQEFREQNQRKVWKEDVLQLRTMMWFAWLSCRQQEGFEMSEDSPGE